MKFKLNKKNAASEGLTVASATGGALLSRGTKSLIPSDKRGALLYGGVALASVIAAASIQGNGTGEKISRGVLAGVAIEQMIDLTTELVKPSITEVTEESTKGEKFIAAMFGLNGAEDSSPYVIPAEAWNQRKEQTSGNPFTVENVASV